MNGEIRQDDMFNRMVFSVMTSWLMYPLMTLKADDVITGTPTGNSARFDPPRYLSPGDEIEVEVSVSENPKMG